ncbi:hypothetical protein [Streptomyces sp. NPDC088246]|uniref:hypothetical protein n=1 Tax=Streptomyces sp. NPDC088246 TaxID=3365842 RepID=UPI00381956CF
MFAGHGGTPLGNQSALDAAVMTATMPEFLREEDLAPSGRLHRLIDNGGDISGITPETAEIPYHVREGGPARVQVLLDKVIALSGAAARVSRTTVRHRITSRRGPRPIDLDRVFGRALRRVMDSFDR